MTDLNEELKLELERIRQEELRILRKVFPKGTFQVIYDLGEHEVVKNKPIQVRR